MSRDNIGGPRNKYGSNQQANRKERAEEGKTQRKVDTNPDSPRTIIFKRILRRDIAVRRRKEGERTKWKGGEVVFSTARRE